MDDGKILLVIASAVQKASIDDPLLVPGISREELVLTNEESDRKALKVLEALRANNLNVVDDISLRERDVQESAERGSAPSLNWGLIGASAGDAENSRRPAIQSFAPSQPSLTMSDWPRRSHRT